MPRGSVITSNGAAWPSSGSEGPVTSPTPGPRPRDKAPPHQLDRLATQVDEHVAAEDQIAALDLAGDGGIKLFGEIELTKPDVLADRGDYASLVFCALEVAGGGVLVGLSERPFAIATRARFCGRPG